MAPQTEELKYVPALCVHEPYEPDDTKGWYIFGMASRNIYVRVCKHCGLLYVDLAFRPQASKEIH